MRQRSGRQVRENRSQDRREEEPRSGWEPIPLHVELWIDRAPAKREEPEEASSHVIIIDLA